MPALPSIPAGDRPAVEAWVARELGDLTFEGPDGIVGSTAFAGGQDAADAALRELDVAGYARKRNEVWPAERRGATRLSPYIRHGLLPLPEVWAAVEDAPPRDRGTFRDELLWQEYARHLYARVGGASARSLRRQPAAAAERWPEPWTRRMACMTLTTDMLRHEGWLVNQTRMWMASQWTLRGGAAWQEGEDRFFRHLLDGSRAANRLGWQWTVGAGTGRPYGFSRWQVEKRAPGLCATCELRDACPIQEWPETPAGASVEPPPGLKEDPDPEATGGPVVAERVGDGGKAEPDLEPDAVWLTAESLGTSDPALAAHPDLPAIFVFDRERLAAWRLSGKRLVFLAETLGEIAERRPVELHLGDPAEVLAGRRLAATFTPVPGWHRLVERLDVVERHPWPWLTRPHAKNAASFSAWRKRLPKDRQRGA